MASWVKLFTAAELASAAPLRCLVCDTALLPSNLGYTVVRQSDDGQVPHVGGVCITCGLNHSREELAQRVHRHAVLVLDEVAGHA